MISAAGGQPGQRAGDLAPSMAQAKPKAGLAAVPLLTTWAVKVTSSPGSGQRRSFSVPGQRKGRPGWSGTSYHVLHAVGLVQRRPVDEGDVQVNTFEERNGCHLSFAGRAVPR